MPQDNAASTDRERNAARTREAILDAAEALFAEKGYGATSLQEVGTRAGVSRATPGYFFGAKAELYQAVLDRCLEQVRQAVRSGQARAIASGEAAQVVLAGAVGEYFDFITAHPDFVRLMEWEALGAGPTPSGAPPHIGAVHEALEAISMELGLDIAQRGEAAQLLLSILGLCWFPLVHSATMQQALGFDPRAPEFLAARKRHVVDLVLRGTKGWFATTANANAGAA